MIKASSVPMPLRVNGNNLPRVRNGIEDITSVKGIDNPTTLKHKCKFI
jgi:hypothetical protein